MKRFKFRLEVVEKHRRLKEQERQVQLSRALEKLRATEDKLLDLDMREVAARREFAALGEYRGNKDLNKQEFWMLDQFIQGQKVRRVDLKERLQLEEQLVGQAYAEFLAARQQKKIMEKLREKTEAKYKEELRKFESRETDGQYTMRSRLRGDITENREDEDE